MEKVNQLSNEIKFRENPGYVIKDCPQKFNVKEVNLPLKFCIDRKIRLSIDTQSDLDFFRLLYIKEKKKIDLISVKKNKNLSLINEHVRQKKPEDDNEKIIKIITIKSKKYGLGHYKRMMVLKRNIRNIFIKNICS